MNAFGGYTYILTNKTNQALYIGVTENLAKRIYQHKHKLLPGFTSKYNVNKLVYYEYAEKIETAIAREKQLKAGSRKKKVELIESMNPEWNDLFDDVMQ